MPAKAKKKFATCEQCKREMKPGSTCNKTMFAEPNTGKVKPAARVGEHPHDMNTHGDNASCHDCNAKRGGFHHSGCDNERCPHCGGQAIGCMCDDKWLNEWAVRNNFPTPFISSVPQDKWNGAYEELGAVKHKIVHDHVTNEGKKTVKKATTKKPAVKKPTAKKPAKKATTKKPAVKKPTIRALAEKLLLNPKLSYNSILTKVQQTFPSCKTSYACLRWYAAKMREQRIELPERPRDPKPEVKKPVKKVAKKATKPAVKKPTAKKPAKKATTKK